MLVEVVLELVVVVEDVVDEVEVEVVLVVELKLGVFCGAGLTQARIAWPVSRMLGPAPSKIAQP